jgi:hypothetical protein
MARDFLPLVDACLAVGIAYNTAWRLCLTGKVPARREGRAWFVQLDALRRATAPVPATPKDRAAVVAK